MISRKMTWTMVVVTILILVIGVLFVKETKTEKIKVGYHVVSLKHPYAVKLATAFETEARRRGFVPIVASGKDDRLQELKNIDYFIEQEVDAIFVTALDSDFINKAIIRANEAKIPVFAIDRKMNNVDVISTIASDNVDIGKQVAYFMIDRLKADKGSPKGNIVEIRGSTNVSATIERSEGFRTILSNYPDIQLIDVAYGDYDSYKSKRETEEMLKKQPVIDGIFGHNDDIILGVHEAWKESGKRERPMMVGVDGIPEVKALIDRNQVDATVVQSAGQIIKISFDTFEDHLAGKEVDPFIKIKADIYK